MVSFLKLPPAASWHWVLLGFTITNPTLGQHRTNLKLGKICFHCHPCHSEWVAWNVTALLWPLETQSYKPSPCLLLPGSEIEHWSCWCHPWTGNWAGLIGNVQERLAGYGVEPLTVALRREGEVARASVGIQNQDGEKRGCRGCHGKVYLAVACWSSYQMKRLCGIHEKEGMELKTRYLTLGICFWSR